ETIFNIYYLLLFLISALIVHHFDCLAHRDVPRPRQQPGRRGAWLDEYGRAGEETQNATTDPYCERADCKQKQTEARAAHESQRPGQAVGSHVQAALMRGREIGDISG